MASRSVDRINRWSLTKKKVRITEKILGGLFFPVLPLSATDHRV
jgi:hypothetical protein